MRKSIIKGAIASYFILISPVAFGNKCEIYEDKKCTPACFEHEKFVAYDSDNFPICEQICELMEVAHHKQNAAEGSQDWYCVFADVELPSEVPETYFHASN